MFCLSLLSTVHKFVVLYHNTLYQFEEIKEYLILLIFRSDTDPYRTTCFFSNLELYLHVHVSRNVRK